jgi:hypothetical protein
LSAGPPVAPAFGTCGEGPREVRGGGSGDPTPYALTHCPPGEAPEAVGGVWGSRSEVLLPILLLSGGDLGVWGGKS